LSHQTSILEEDASNPSFQRLRQCFSVRFVPENAREAIKILDRKSENSQTADYCNTNKIASNIDCRHRTETVPI